MTDDGKDKAAVSLGKRGGKSRAKALNLDCARKAAIAALQRFNLRIDAASFRISLSPSAEVH